MVSVAPPNPPDARPTAMVLAGRYSLEQRIARGGMGEVWAALDTVLGRQVAVKILRDELVDSPNFLARFRAEARHTASLAHHGIANVFDYGEEQHGDRCVAYLVMELVPGAPLSTVMAERGGTLPLDVALSVLAQTARALHAAHLVGVVHRDVKPGNLLVLDDGTIKVTDFGIARAASSAALTEVGQMVGTARYMSPEQAAGGDVTPASDVYSLGVIGYEMLAGQPPFVADNPAALAMAHVHQPPPPLPAAVPAGVGALIGEALAKRPSDRPRDAQAFAERIDRLRATSVGPSVVMGALAGAGASDAPPTQVMGFGDGRHTAIMPAQAVVAADPRLASSSSLQQPRRHRRWIAGVALAAVLAMVGLAQLGAVDGSSLHRGAVRPPVPATTVTTATTIASVPATTTAPAAVIVNSSAPKAKAVGHGHKKDHEPKD